jgi:hypothetical protein
VHRVGGGEVTAKKGADVLKQLELAEASGNKTTEKKDGEESSEGEVREAETIWSIIVFSCTVIQGEEAGEEDEFELDDDYGVDHYASDDERGDDGGGGGGDEAFY